MNGSSLRNVDLVSKFPFSHKFRHSSNLADRRDGEKFMGEIEQSYTKLTDFFGALAKHRKRGQHLLGEIEKAKRSFALQLRDVTVVEDVGIYFFLIDIKFSF